MNTNSNLNSNLNQNINSLTQNLLNSIFPSINNNDIGNGLNTITETVTFIPSTQNMQQMQPPNDGLSLNDLRNYTTLNIYSNSDENNQIKCEICHDNINEGDILRMVNICNHSFHQECVDSWFENNTICPYCRCNVMENITTDNLEINTETQDTPNNE